MVSEALRESRESRTALTLFHAACKKKKKGKTFRKEDSEQQRRRRRRGGEGKRPASKRGSDWKLQRPGGAASQMMLEGSRSERGRRRLGKEAMAGKEGEGGEGR